MIDVARRLAAEFLGTALLLFVIVGSGIAAGRLGDDTPAQLLAHALTVGLGLGALIAFLAPVSGAHFNPAVTLGFWRTGEIATGLAGAYVGVQVAGAIGGVLLANWSFDAEVWAISTTTRDGAGLVAAELVVTFVLVLLIVGLVRCGSTNAVAPVVGAWVAAGIFGTASTGFANPAVTLARMGTATFTGIDPGSVPAFVAAQLVAGLAAAGVAVFLFPTRPSSEGAHT